VALQCGDAARAAGGLREVVVRCRDAGLRDPLPEALLGLAVTAVRDGDAGRAGCLQGAAVARAGQLRRPPGIGRVPPARPGQGDRRRRCGTESWRRDARGAALELDEALTLAVGPSAGDGWRSARAAPTRDGPPGPGPSWCGPSRGCTTSRDGRRGSRPRFPAGV